MAIEKLTKYCGKKSGRYGSIVIVKSWAVVMCITCFINALFCSKIMSNAHLKRQTKSSGKRIAVTPAALN